MHKIVEFQAVVLAAGRGSRMPDVGATVTKCLLPVGPYPVLWYSLKMLEKIGIQEAMVIVLEDDKSNILNALAKCPLSIKYELIVIPSDEDWGTVDSLKHISSRITSDLLVVSGDLITDINLNDVLNLHRKHNASLTTLFFDNGPEEWIQLPGIKEKNKPDTDFVGIDKETQRLVFLASASDFEQDLQVPSALIKKFNSLYLYSKLLDAHVYVMKRWIVDYIAGNDKFTSVKGELVPHIVKKQLAKYMPETQQGNSEKNLNFKKSLFELALESGYESQIRHKSGYNDQRLANKGVYHENMLRCYAFVPSPGTFGMRINKMSSYYLANNKILSRWQDITGSQPPERFYVDNVINTKQIDETCIVGDQSTISEKTSIKNTFIGFNCTVEKKVRLTNCILMNNVTIKEGSVLQDCIIYYGATVNSSNLQHCIVGPHHEVEAGSTGTHQLFSETSDNMITLG